MLSWLLAEGREGEVRRVLAGAHSVATSDLTWVECDRALHRAAEMRAITEAAAEERRGVIAGLAHEWTSLHLHAEILDRARARFPVEPVRSLDAIHLASALVFARLGSVTVLSLDERIRINARALGLAVSP